MSNDIRSILERIKSIEAQITPVDVKHGLNRQQQSVRQMPALFRPKRISPVLTARQDPQHPAAGMLVGASESQHMASEDLLGKKKSLADYLTDIQDRRPDRDLSQVAADRELGQRAKSRDLVRKPAMEDPTQFNPVIQQPSPVKNYPTYATEMACVRSMTMENGSVMEIRGDDESGYHVRCGQRGLRTKFVSLDEAEMACEMYMARSRQQASAQVLDQDYMEEA